MKIPSFSSVPQELKAIVQWLNIFSQKVVEGFKTIFDAEVIYIVPTKPQVGMIRYFGTGTPLPITYEGLWVYTSTGWKPCNLP